MDFDSHMAAERKRLHEERGKIDLQITEWMVTKGKVDLELAAIDAYEAAKKGKPALRVIGFKERAASTDGDRQPRRDSKRQAILDLVEAFARPVKRAELLESLGVKGDKSGEMSVSNALTALIKAKALVRADGGYRLAA